MPTVIITGANRGLGLEFARQYAADGWDVVAAARASSLELDALNVRYEQLDMLDFERVVNFGERIDPVDLLIANAGIYGPLDAANSDDARMWLDTFKVNTISPYLLARSVLAQVTKSQGTLVAITSKMGSIEDDQSGGYLAYRSSKTALNSAWRNLAIEVRPNGVIAAVLHPGWVQTRMGGSSAPLRPNESVSGMRRVIAGLKAADSGAFLSFDGKHIPW